MIIWFENIGAAGINKDIDPWDIPKEHWSDGKNVKFANDRAEKCDGYADVYTATGTAKWLLDVPTTTTNFWLYPSLTKAYATDGTTHSDITRTDVSGTAIDYAADDSFGWVGSNFGEFAIFTNGVNVPQQWGDSSAGPALSKVAKNLENWDVTGSVSCKFIRPFKNYLIAGDITESGVRKPNLLWWSHPAAFGTVPSSWDYTDTTKDAGRYELEETNDFLVDSLALHDYNIVYKDNSTWGMQYIGAPNIFRFFRIFPRNGMIAKNCAAQFLGRYHAVIGLNDIYTHDAQTYQSIMKSRMKDWFYNTIDDTYYKRSFVTPYHAKEEIWFCFPEAGQTKPNLALVWNYKENTTYVRDLPSVDFIAPGIVNQGVDETWDADSGTWDSDDQEWNWRNYSPIEQALLMTSGTTSTRLAQADYDSQYGGSNMNAYIERQALPTDGAHHTFKEVFRVYPVITGTAGGTVDVKIITQNIPGGTSTYSDAQTFTIGTTEHLDFRVLGKVIGVRFESTGDLSWSMSRFGMEVIPMGER